MKHFITEDQRTIYINYIDEIEVEHAVELTDQVIKILENTKATDKKNFVLNLTEAYITNILSLKSAANAIKPYHNKMNNAYIVGASGIQLTFAKMFVKFIGSFINISKLKFFDTIEEAEKDIDWCWQHYVIKHKNNR